METRANYVAVGMFMLAVIACGFLFILWLARTGDGTSRQEIVVTFPGAVTGLLKGGQVLFNGINVGEVKRLQLDPTDPKRVVVVVTVDDRAPIKVDTKAELGYQGLTGVAYVHLRGGTKAAQSLFDMDRPEIQAGRSGLEDLMDGARQLMERAQETLVSIQKVVDDNSPSLKRSVDNVEKFTIALGNNAEGIANFLTDISSAAKSFTSLATRLEGLANNVESILSAVDPMVVEQVLGNVKSISGELALAAKKVAPVMEDIRLAAGKLREFGDMLAGTLAKVDNVVGAVDSEKIASIVKSVEALSARLSGRGEDIEAFITSARSAAEGADKVASEIAAKSEDIKSIITDVKSATSKLDGAVEKADKLIASVDAEAVSATVANIRSLTDTLAARGADIDAIIGDTRAAMTDVRSVTGDIEERREDIRQIITDTKQLASRLNAAAAQVEGIIKKVDGMVGGDSSGFFTEAAEAAAAIRRVAKAFESRADVIASGLARFSDRGLRDIEAMVKDWRRAGQKIERAASKFERDPQRFLFGNSDTRAFSPRR
jgi:phospholipid/cholesterol/gamma-HCH transport system substrate-binding protein